MTLLRFAGRGTSLLATGVLAAACSFLPGRASSPAPNPPAGISAPAEPAPSDLGAIMLHVENHGYDDIVISIVRGSSPERVARVGAANKWSGALDRWLDPKGGEVRLLAEPIGARTYGPESALRVLVRLQPGQSLIWTIEKNIRASFYEVR